MALDWQNASEIVSRYVKGSPNIARVDDLLIAAIRDLEQRVATLEAEVPNPPEFRVFDQGGGVYESELFRLEFKDGSSHGHAFDVQVES